MRKQSPPVEKEEAVLPQTGIGTKTSPGLEVEPASIT
jgi:hypothetical protein